MNVVDEVSTLVSWGVRTGSSILTLGPDGFARIVYPKSDGSLWVFTCHDDDCSPAKTTSNKIADAETYVPGPGASGMEITMGHDGFPRVAYINDDGDPNYPHHFVRCLDADCANSVNTVIGEPTSWGFGSAGISLAIGTDGFARIVYRQDPDTLEYVRCREENCDSSNPETSPVITQVVNDPTGYYPGIYGVVVRMGSDGFARIAYKNQNYELHYVTCSDSDCATPSDETVATDASLLESNGFGLAIRSGDLASIAYTTESDGIIHIADGYLHLINCTNQTCSSSDNIIADSDFPNGDYLKGISLVVGSNNLPRLLYSGAYNNGVGVRYTYFSSPASTDSVKKSVDIGDKECKLKDLKVKVLPNGKIKLSWKKPCSVIDKIEIERKAEKGEFEKIAIVKKDKHTYEDDGSKLPSGKYTYRIRGYRKASGKHSDYSSKKSVTIQHPTIPTTTKPNEPTLPPEESQTPPPPPAVLEVPQNTPQPVINPKPSKPSSLGKVMGEAIVVAKQVTKKFSTGLTTLAIAGLATGAAIAASSTAIPLFATSPAPLSEAVSKLFGIFGFVGKKKKEDDWGVVFDSQTRQPLSGATVSIIDEAGHVIDTATSDSHGRYGFLPKPGSYTLAVNKKDYELEKTNQQDILYGDLYTDQPIKIEGNEMKKISLSLKNTTLNWQDFAQRKIASYTSIFSIIKRDFFFILFYAGFVTNVGIAFLFPTILNISLSLIYLGMLIYHAFFKKKTYGLITNTQNKQPVPFTMVSIYAEGDFQKRVDFAVSDVLGRYFILTENGNYFLKASGNFLGGQHFEKTIPINIKDGVVRSDVGV